MKTFALLLTLTASAFATGIPIGWPEQVDFRPHDFLAGIGRPLEARPSTVIQCVEDLPGWIADWDFDRCYRYEITQDLRPVDLWELPGNFSILRPFHRWWFEGPELVFSVQGSLLFDGEYRPGDRHVWLWQSEAITGTPEPATAALIVIAGLFLMLGRIKQKSPGI